MSGGQWLLRVKCERRVEDRGSWQVAFLKQKGGGSSEGFRCRGAASH